eukprot:7922522-Alexandrium_andersonii.AAC.1
MSASLVGSEMCIRDSMTDVRESRSRMSRILVQGAPLIPERNGKTNDGACLLYTSDAADDM